MHIILITLVEVLSVINEKFLLHKKQQKSQYVLLVFVDVTVAKKCLADRKRYSGPTNRILYLMYNITVYIVFWWLLHNAYTK